MGPAGLCTLPAINADLRGALRVGRRKEPNDRAHGLHSCEGQMDFRKMRRCISLVLWLAVVVVVDLGSASAQSSITGVVQDPAGAAIAGAKVELREGLF